jgi:hypothetical protein
MLSECVVALSLAISPGQCSSCGTGGGMYFSPGAGSGSWSAGADGFTSSGDSVAYGGGGGGDQLFPYDSPEPWLRGHFQEIPAYGGYATFRPHNYKHVLAQTELAGAWGLNPAMGYSHQWYHKYRQRSGMHPNFGLQHSSMAAPGFENLAQSSPEFGYPAMSGISQGADQAPVSVAAPVQQTVLERSDRPLSPSGGPGWQSQFASGGASQVTADEYQSRLEQLQRQLEEQSWQMRQLQQQLAERQAYFSQSQSAYAPGPSGYSPAPTSSPPVPSAQRMLPPAGGGYQELPPPAASTAPGILPLPQSIQPAIPSGLIPQGQPHSVTSQPFQIPNIQVPAGQAAYSVPPAVVQAGMVQFPAPPQPQPIYEQAGSWQPTGTPSLIPSQRTAHPVPHQFVPAERRYPDSASQPQIYRP